MTTNERVTRSRRIVAVVAAAALVGSPVAARASTSAADPGGDGGVRCPEIEGTRCGTITVPLDRARPRDGTVNVAYALVQRTRRDRPAAGTIAVLTGGPGQPAIALAPTGAELLAPLRTDHDILIVDPRGTGESGRLGCDVADDTLLLPRAAMLRAVGRCGDDLGERAAHYTSAAIADDLDAVRAHLGIGRLDLFAISYGTYLAGVYADRHPAAIRSMVLSGAFPLDHDTWKRSNARTAVQALARVCESGGCDPATVRSDLATVAASLRRRPLPFRYATDGVPRTGLLDEATLGNVVYNAGNYPKWERWGKLPAILHEAALGKPARLLKLAVEEKLDEYPLPRAEDGASLAQGLAVMCNDYPTAYDRRAPVPVRMAQYQRRRAALDPRPFAPFSAQGWTDGMDEGTDLCVRWTANRKVPAPRYGPAPDVPVLVLSGALDPNTTPEEGRAAAARYRRSFAVEFPNTAHFPSLEPTGCATRITLAFIRELNPGDLSCLSKIPPIPVERH